MTAVLLAFAVFPMIASASVQDKVARFSTPGPDCYADGTLVADGECYALVWSPKGATFAGFNADGTAISANDRVILFSRFRPMNTPSSRAANGPSASSIRAWRTGFRRVSRTTRLFA